MVTHRPYYKHSTAEPRPLAELVIFQRSVHEKVNALKINESSSPDNILSKLLKLAGNAIVPTLMSLCRCSAARGSVLYLEDSKTYAHIQKGAW